MSAAAILMWAQVGVQLINVLGVPVANIVKLFKESGGTDAEADALIGHWASLTQSIEARIAFQIEVHESLRKQVNSLERRNIELKSELEATERELADMRAVVRWATRQSETPQ